MLQHSTRIQGWKLEPICLANADKMLPTFDVWLTFVKKIIQNVRNFNQIPIKRKQRINVFLSTTVMLHFNVDVLDVFAAAPVR